MALKLKLVIPKAVVKQSGECGKQHLKANTTLLLCLFFFKVY